jgi:hypothetical protein
VAAFFRSLADAATLGENVLTQLGLVRSLSEALSLDESIARQLVYLIAKSEPISLADAIDIVVIPLPPVEPEVPPPAVVGVPGGRGYWPSKEYAREEEKRLLELRAEEPFWQSS